MNSLNEMPPISPEPLKGQRPTYVRRLARAVLALKRRRVTVLRIDGPARPARPYNYSHLGITLIAIGLVTSVVVVGARMADYDAKRTALVKQNALTAQLMDEQEHLLDAREAQTRHLVDLAGRVQRLQEKLTTLQAFRQKVKTLLAEGPAAVSFGSDQSHAAVSRPEEHFAMGGGRPNEAELLEWAQDELKQADEGASRLKEQMARLQADVRGFNRKLNHTPSIWPVRGRITSGFGYRTHPITRQRVLHDGLDIAVLTGTPVHAAADGKVVRSGRHGGYGLVVEVDHDYGVRTLYGHNSRLAAKVGDVVKKGEVIAYAGSTGLSTGPHVHYQVIVGSKSVDPVPYLP